MPYAVVAAPIVLGSTGCGKFLRTESEVEEEFINGLKKFGKVIDYELDEYFSTSYSTGYLCGGWWKHYSFVALIMLNDNAVEQLAGYLCEWTVTKDNEIHIELFDDEVEARKHFEQLLDP